MLNDQSRNTAFTEAVARAVAAATARLDGRHPTVLEIGSGGTGLLAMAAAKAGALPVLSVELDPVLAKKARATVAHNGFSQDSIRVLELHSEALCREDFGPPGGAHVIVAELFDDPCWGSASSPPSDTPWITSRAASRMGLCSRYPHEPASRRV